jgi:Outer membrane protein beta-barrel domain
MKHLFSFLTFCLFFMGNLSLAQQKKPISPKKPTTVKTTVPKTTTKSTTTTTSKPATTTTTKPSTTTTTTTPPAPQPKVEEKKPAKTTTTTSPPTKTEVPDEQPSSTTVQQSTGPLKGNKLDEEVAKEPKPKKVKKPKIPIEGRAIKFGMRAEATQHFTLETGSGIDLSPGINIGVLANLPITDQIAIQPEVLFSLINIQASTDESNYVKSSIGSILVPLMFNFNFGSNDRKFMLNLGGYTNYGLSQSTKVIQLGKTVKDGSIDLGNDRFDYGLGVGVGVKLNNKFMIEARSFYGMKDNINKNGFGTIGVGYFF